MTFSKLLIANRGEIAVRIAETCRQMGIASVAVFSSVDRDALHVLVAGEAYEIGPAPALESYLNIDAVLDAAMRSGSQAIHPGYGFLAENAGFARRVLAAGLIWIGPSPEAIELLGDKVAAKELAQSALVPVLPGYSGEDQSAARMLHEAESIGYPFMIKASAGGGGKGMRAVHAPGDLPGALEGARREAKASFGDDRVFLERLIIAPRHVEIQILADSHKRVVSLGERDCSIQRRHQKVVEEAPSPAISPAMRAAMSADAARLARTAGYRSAGTVEFLVDGDGYYFLEMNTRIQVEHPVTEMVTGLDLIRLQIEIAAGAEIPFSQEEVHLDGHAIEIRLYAEDPTNDFLPATGRLHAFRPPEGPGIRNDVGVYAGFEVTPYYDPLLAKLIVHGRDRNEAVHRLQSALSRYDVDGIVTNLGFLQWIANEPVFNAGTADTAFLERRWSPDELTILPDEILMAAAAFDTLFPCAPEPTVSTESVNPWRRRDSWRASGVPRNFAYIFRGREFSIQASPVASGSWLFRVAGRTCHASISAGPDEDVILRTATHQDRLQVFAERRYLHVEWGSKRFDLLRPVQLVSGRLATGSGGEYGALAAPMPGTVIKVAVAEGDQVAAHDPLVVLEAMKMEHIIQAPRDGVVEAVLVDVGDLVPAGSPLVRLSA